MLQANKRLLEMTQIGFSRDVLIFSERSLTPVHLFNYTELIDLRFPDPK